MRVDERRRADVIVAGCGRGETARPRIEFVCHVEELVRVRHPIRLPARDLPRRDVAEGDTRVDGRHGEVAPRVARDHRQRRPRAMANLWLEVLALRETNGGASLNRGPVADREADGRAVLRDVELEVTRRRE